jgi:hypothetical protein
MNTRPLRAGSWAAALVSLVAPVPVWAAKTDVVELLNGDRITGEVKELAYGQLRFATDDMGTLYIEWSKIASLTSTRTLQVEMLDGRRLSAAAAARGDAPATLRLVGDAPQDVPIAGIARITALDTGSGLERLYGSLSVGYSFTQASDVQVFNLGTSIGSRRQSLHWRVSLDAQMTSQQEAPSSQRATLAGSRERFMADGWYREATLSFTRNQELGLDLRSLVGGGLGRYLVRRADTEWRAGIGLAASAEELTDGTRRESVELQLGTTFNIFRFDAPQMNLAASLMVLPSLSESGRIRGEAALRLRREMVEDLFLEVSLYDSYDNRTVAGTRSNDWGLATSLGYSF